jgi:hypothetical protein
MARLKPFARASLLALLTCLQVSVAGAEDADREARERYESAVKLYEDGAYDAALVELNRAAELRPSYKLYYNIGQVRFAMHDYAAASDAYRQYLEKGGDKVPPARREQLKKELDVLAQRVAKLNIETDVAGAEVFVDDVSVGITPLPSAVVVNSGIRRVTVRHPDYLPQVRRLNIAGGVQEKVSFALVNGGATGVAPAPVAATPATAPGPAAPAHASAPARAARPLTAPVKSAPVSAPSNSGPEHAGEQHVPWVGWAATGALVAGATVTGVLALSANSSLSRDRGQLSISSSEVDSKASKVRTLAIVTDSLVAAAVLAGGVSLWLTLSPGSSHEEPEKAGHTPLALGVGPSGIRLKGAF